MLHHDCLKLKEKRPCWNKSKDRCMKDFPKQYVEETYTDKVTGRVFYKRSDNTDDNITLENGRYVNNSFVVPYNVFLLKYFNAHINIEIVNQILAVSYLFKYFVKDGETNRVNVELLFNDEKKDEISEYQKVRCVGPTDATWKIFEYPIVANTVTVEVLYVYEKPYSKGKYKIPVEDNDFMNAPELNTNTEAFKHLITTNTIGKSKLMAYFDLMMEESNKSKPNQDILNLTYENVPTMFKWDPLHPKDQENLPRREREAWIRRKINIKVIGRIVAIPKTKKELFAMRVLLIHKKGVKSFDDLKTIDGIRFETYHDAAKFLNLIKQGVLEIDYFNELKNMLTPPEFTSALVIYICQEPEFIYHLKVFNLHKDYMNQVYLPRYRNGPNGRVSEIIVIEKANNHLLYQIYLLLTANEYNMKKSNLTFDSINFEDIIDQDGVSIEEDAILLQRYVNNATRGQLDGYEAFKTIFNSTRDSKVIIVEGPAGTGKTYLYNMLSTYLRTESKKYINFATTGIAASLLHQGQTVHSLFKMLLNINEPEFVIEPRRIRGLPEPERLRIKHSDVIFIDEVSMLSVKQLAYVDSVLRLHFFRHKPFGGKLIIFGGDFRQCLPIIKNQTTAEIVGSTILSSKYFTHGHQVKRIYLTENMRALENERNFAEFLLQVGNGVRYDPNINYTLDGRMDDNRLVTIPENMIFEGTLDDFVEGIFGKTKEELNTNRMSAILAPTNATVSSINEQILLKFYSHSIETFYSNDE
uniref:ATP-dependent DNA helicase n=1 Tax=Strongyloides papillosus TaxID=174720 RepID=A0A0N5BCR2_STREA